MDLSILLAKFFGLYMIITGLYLIVRHDQMRFVVQNLVTNPALITFSGVLALMLGLLILLIHPVWTLDWRGAITVLFGVIPVLQGIMRLFFFDQIRPWAERSMTGNGPYYAGAVMLLIGAIFAHIGFWGPYHLAHMG